MSPNVLKAALAGALTLLENGIYKLQGPKNSAKWLWGNFQPIPPPADLFAADLPIEGRLPPELSGLFARNGPNPVHINSGLHWFDGDGFIHAVMLDAITQRANYSAQLVRTNKLKQEMAAGRALFHKFGDAEGPLTLGLMMIEKARIGLGIVDVSRGKYGGNTALLWHAGQFFALHEGEQPHLLRVEPDGRIATVGRVHKAGAEPSSFFTAHPKVDPHTHKLYAFGYDLEKPPYNTYYQLDEDGEVVRLVPFQKWAKPAMVHDFSITENHAVFFEACLYIDPPSLLKGQPLFRFDEDKPLRFAVLPLDAESEAKAKWFEAKPGYIFHTANSWEEEGGKVIRVLAARYDHFELNFDGTIDKNLTEQAMTFSREELDRRSTHLHEYTLDMESGELKESRLVTQEMDGRSHEFPQVHPLLLGRRTRYVYMTAFDGKGEPAALVKVDLEAEGGLALQTLDLGEETYAGEAIFVPKEGSETGAEDEGYLLTFTYSYKTNSSDFRVYDARTMSSTPVARVPLPRRVPYGFHGIWVPQEELNHQKCPAGQQAQAS